MRHVFQRLVGEHGRLAFVDSTPWNLSCSTAEVGVSGRVFVSCCGSLPGVCQSLERSYAAGYLWRSNDEDRARYGLILPNLAGITVGRTVAVSYDLLCQAPDQTRAIVEVLARQDGRR